MRDALIAEILAETGIVTFQQVRYRLNRSYVAVLSVIPALPRMFFAGLKLTM